MACGGYTSNGDLGSTTGCLSTTAPLVATTRPETTKLAITETSKTKPTNQLTTEALKNNSATTKLLTPKATNTLQSTNKVFKTSQSFTTRKDENKSQMTEIVANTKAHTLKPQKTKLSSTNLITTPQTKTKTTTTKQYVTDEVKFTTRKSKNNLTSFNPTLSSLQITNLIGTKTITAIVVQNVTRKNTSYIEITSRSSSVNPVTTKYEEKLTTPSINNENSTTSEIK